MNCYAGQTVGVMEAVTILWEAAALLPPAFSVRSVAEPGKWLAVARGGAKSAAAELGPEMEVALGPESAWWPLQALRPQQWIQAQGPGSGPVGHLLSPTS